MVINYGYTWALLRCFVFVHFDGVFSRRGGWVSLPVVSLLQTPLWNLPQVVAVISRRGGWVSLPVVSLLQTSSWTLPHVLQGFREGFSPTGSILALLVWGSSSLFVGFLSMKQRYIHLLTSQRERVRRVWSLRVWLHLIVLRVFRAIHSCRWKGRKFPTKIILL